jgi:hypothetical protein
MAQDGVDLTLVGDPSNPITVPVKDKDKPECFRISLV